MNKEELISLIESLKISKDEFYVLSSGALVLRDILKTANDLDIAVTVQGLEALKLNFSLKKKENDWYTVTDKIECICVGNIDNLNNQPERIGDYYIQNIKEYYEYLQTSIRDKDKKRIPLIENYCKIKQLQTIIEQSKRIVFFGGAGVSTESGIPDFRSTNGLFHKYSHQAEEMLSHHFYKQHPQQFYDFYQKEMIHKEAKPNICHLALKKLEDMKKLSAIITQNIDGLHTLAGNKKVYELHGSIYRNYCEKCHKFYSLEELLHSHVCKCGGSIKPDVVLYEEPLDNKIYEGALQEVRKADLLIIGGTSLAVYPANLLIHEFRGKNLVIINKTPTPMEQIANLVIHDSLSKVFAYLLETENQSK